MILHRSIPPNLHKAQLPLHLIIEKWGGFEETVAWPPPLDSAQNVALKSDAAIGINIRKPWKGICFDFDAPGTPESEFAATTTAYTPF